MSHNNSEPIPTVVLVPPEDKAERMAPRSKDSLAAAFAPWMQTIALASIGFVVLLALVGVVYMFRGERARLDAEPIAAPPAPKGEQIAAVKNQPNAVANPPAVAPQPANVEQPAPGNNNDQLQNAAAPAPGEFVDCARIGTRVRFMKEPIDAFKRAADERKMVFMMHLSGNLEDKEFT